MTLAYWCVLIAALLPYLWVAVAKFGGSSRKNFDNHAPRAYLATVEGAQQRANWAQMNAFEAFAPFAAAVVIAHLAGTDQGLINTLALAFIAARVLHGVFYVLDQALLRSLAWTVGIGCVVALFVVSA